MIVRPLARVVLTVNSLRADPLLALESLRLPRWFLGLLIAGTLQVAPAAVHAQRLSLSVAGGPAAPISAEPNTLRSGYSLSVGANVQTSADPLGARLEATFSRFVHKNGAGAFQVKSLTANAVLLRGNPYLIGGVGYFNARDSEALRNQTVSSVSHTVGLNGGAGLRLPFRELTPYVEARYQWIAGETYRIVAVTLGITL